VFPRLEMRVRKTKEDLGKLALLEEVREKLHGIGAKASDVLVETSIRILVSKGFDPILYKFRDLRSDLQTCTNE